MKANNDDLETIKTIKVHEIFFFFTKMAISNPSSNQLNSILKIV